MRCLHCLEIVQWGDAVVYVGYERWVHIHCFIPHITEHPDSGRALLEGRNYRVGKSKVVENSGGES